MTHLHIFPKPAAQLNESARTISFKDDDNNSRIDVDEKCCVCRSYQDKEGRWHEERLRPCVCKCGVTLGQAMEQVKKISEHIKEKES